MTVRRRTSKGPDDVMFIVGITDCYDVGPADEMTIVGVCYTTTAEEALDLLRPDVERHIDSMNLSDPEELGIWVFSPDVVNVEQKITVTL